MHSVRYITPVRHGMLGKVRDYLGIARQATRYAMGGTQKLMLVRRRYRVFAMFAARVDTGALMQAHCKATGEHRKTRVHVFCARLGRHLLPCAFFAFV